jgi:hypothetical protein
MLDEGEWPFPAKNKRKEEPESKMRKNLKFAKE